MRKKTLLPKAFYTRIVAAVPILCVDLLIHHRGRWLLVKRKNEPLAKQWWVAGGRVMRDERVHDAARRIAAEEVGLDLGDVRLHGIYEDVFPRSAANMKDGIHTVSAVFRCEAKTPDVKIDGQSSAHVWTTDLPQRFTRKMLII